MPSTCSRNLLQPLLGVAFFSYGLSTWISRRRTKLFFPQWGGRVAVVKAMILQCKSYAFAFIDGDMILVKNVPRYFFTVTYIGFNHF